VSISSTKLRTGPYTASAVCGLYFPAIQENLAESAQGEQGIWPIKSNSFGPLKQPSNRRLSFPFLARSLPCRTAHSHSQSGSLHLAGRATCSRPCGFPGLDLAPETKTTEGSATTSSTDSATCPLYLYGQGRRLLQVRERN